MAADCGNHTRGQEVEITVALTRVPCAQLILCVPALPLSDCPSLTLIASGQCHATSAESPGKSSVPSSPAGCISSAEIWRELGGDRKCKKSKSGREESRETGEASLGEREPICSSVLGSNKGLSDLHYCICVQASQGLRELCLGGLVQSQAATY